MLSLLRPDPFTLLLVATVALASFLPVYGAGIPIFSAITTAAIALLFFLHGARLSRDAVIAGLVHWRLHLTVLAATFILFPVLGLAINGALAGLINPMLAAGLLYLCLLPSTVQSSIAFTSIAGGNVAAAVCSASASNLLGVFLTPLLVALFMNLKGGVSWGAVGGIVGQILVPFVLGQLLRPWVGAFVGRHKQLVNVVDRGSILLVVFLAFSEAVVHGLWTSLSIDDFVVLFLIDAALLALVLVATTYGSRLLGFNRADEIAIVFCGSKKTLASGLPMASVLFSPQTVGIIVLPLMLFHQIQLMVCAVLARRYARRAPTEGELEAAASPR
ncbi:bile acid:sodium symporter family protein [Chelatococcus reniformis]|uniref:Bile acid:sodium symporter n=1 Tax=Chelatococcus reniformis TaxID=1494448 RepID=A0A916USG3_9HYPH|nr:bile acid:sodium symporter family protein [Chelatococcus reniformis]GGC84546.1 bile acid:sodium symporter [Chelatococcus reniformis]